MLNEKKGFVPTAVVAVAFANNFNRLVDLS